jgi:hypothetical protein
VWHCVVGCFTPYRMIVVASSWRFNSPW